MTVTEWDQLSTLLTQVADQSLPSWKEKQKALEENLSPGGRVALQEIVAWFDGD